ncbi:MAG: hypothetical protein INR66_22650 [Gordonia polyisoprenivorans]|nr:hypothetical protein [Gordonia polyisoprenivorans]
MRIEFDDDVANRLATCASDVAQGFRASAWAWRSCGQDAMDDFHGA